MEEALNTFRTIGRDEFLKKWGRGRSRSYFVLDHSTSEKFDAKAILGAAHELDNPGSDLGDSFYGGMEAFHALTNSFDKAGKSKQFSVSSIDNPAPANYGFSGEFRLLSPVDQEIEDRLNLYKDLPESTLPKHASPTSLRDLHIYGGTAGVWVHKKRTSPLSRNEAGITVSVLHTGSAYPYDSTDDGLIYHYPNTSRPPGRDAAEIEATKEAGRLKVPVFVITYPSSNAQVRNVFLGWVEGWDDKSRIFLISFDTESPTHLFHEIDEDSEPFVMVESRKNSTKSQVTSRPGQQRFRVRVRRRYGNSCLLCDVKIGDLLDAAHIRPKKNRGSDDPRNGLLLCSLHHRAFDAQLFGIEPENLSIQYRKGGPSKSELKIGVDNLSNALKKPAPEVLAWLWKTTGAYFVNPKIG